MGDLIKCPKCGKDTNRYSPTCEYCGEPLPRDVKQPSEPPKAGKAAPAVGSGQTIEEQGRAVFEEVGKHAVRLKKCPYCAEEIQVEAIKCRYCGELLKKPAPRAGKYALLILVVLAVAGALVAAVLMYPGVTNSIMSCAKISALSADLKRDPVKAKYVKDNIVLSDIGTLEETDSISKTATRFFYGTLRNTGNKDVIKLTVTIYYFDKNGKCIAEGTMSPVLGTKAKPDSLKADSSKDFQIPILNADPQWSGSIKAKVSDIELLD